jgi:hypothetical protein
MGLLDGLTGNDKIKLTVSADPLEPGPGDEVKVRFDVAGELDPKCRSLVVGIKGYGAYRENEQYYAENQLQYREVERALSLHSEEREYPIAIGSGEAVFVLPESAPPSSLNVVTWYASAKVNREMAADEAENVAISVRVPVDRMPTARMTQESEDGLVLEDVPVAVRAGDTLTGNLAVTVGKDLSVTAVRVRLHCDATQSSGGKGAPNREGVMGSVRGGVGALSRLAPAGPSSSHESESKQAEVEVSGKREFSAGSTERIPFSIEVPADVGPTTEHDRGHVKWRLEAVLDRRLRGDLAVDMPLIVC